MKNSLIFIDKNREYCCRLEDRIKELSNKRISIQSFIRIEDCLGIIDKIKPDLIILDNYYEEVNNLGFSFIKPNDYEQKQRIDAPFLAFWSDDENISEISRIYRYQSAKKIYENINRILSLKKTNNSSHTSIKYYFDSPYGGSGVSLLARSFSEYLARLDLKKRVFLRSYDIIPEDTNMDDGAFSSWSAIFLASKSKHVEIGTRIRLRELKSKKGYYYFTKPTSYSDYLDLTDFENKRIIDGINSNYDQIVYDSTGKMSFLKRGVAYADILFMVWPKRADKYFIKYYKDVLKKQDIKVIWVVELGGIDKSYLDDIGIDYIFFDGKGLLEKNNYSPKWEDLFYERFR